MINEERFWESAIAEAVRDEAPPDVTARVLAGLAEPEAVSEAPMRKRRQLLALRIVGELAVAAGIVLLIGWLTGVFRAPVIEDPHAEPQNIAAAPGAESEFKDGVVVLRSGWMLVSTGAPDVRCDDSLLSGVDGRVLIHASGVPTPGQAEAVAGWLKANKLEQTMITDVKNWVRGSALAALVLSGSAMLDGQKVEGPKPETAAAPEWHVVRSVMDIDNLPKDAKYVDANGLDAAHLDFLSEVGSLEGISIHETQNLRPEHLKALLSLKKLQWLDIRGAWWMDADKLDLAPLTEMPALKHLAIDLVPAGWGGDPDSYPYAERTLPTIKSLAARGVDIELGAWQPPTQEDLQLVVDAIPTLQGISLWSATAGSLKVLSGNAHLRNVSLRYYDGGEIGLAYLARKSAIEFLDLECESISLDEVHQISRMGLRSLRLSGRLTDSPEMCFELIAGMKTLRELDLYGLGLSADSVGAFSKFSSMQTLDRLRIGNDVVMEIAVDLLLARAVPTRRLELRVGACEIPWFDESPAALRNGKAGDKLEVISLAFSSTDFERTDMNEQQVASLKGYPNLKRIEVKRGGFEQPSMQDQFVNWLKESLPGVEVVVTP